MYVMIIDWCCHCFYDSCQNSGCSLRIVYHAYHHYIWHHHEHHHYNYHMSSIIMTMGLLLLFCWLQLSVHQYAVNVFNAFSFQWVQELKVVWARSLQIDGHFFFIYGDVLFQRQN